MMFTFILQRRDKNDNFHTISRLSKEGNHEFLIQEDSSRFAMLSELALIDQDAFNFEEMPQLILELGMLEKLVTEADSIKHIAALIEMAKACLTDKSLILIITPFGEHYK